MMQWTNEVPGQSRITGLNYRIQNNESVLTWKWPDDVQFVYIYRFPADAEVQFENRPPNAMKLYTREEYKAKQGFVESVDGIGHYVYRVYACERGSDGLLLFLQEDDDNMLQFSTGRATIRYSIKYGKSFFGKMKPVRIELYSDVLVSKEALCYVKKVGSFPLHKEDGTMYPLIQDIAPGRNVLPEFEIPKSDQIKLFFTNGKKYAEIYELIPV
jgi:hypothetical protein